jgi:sensor histidine kinase YesM
MLLAELLYEYCAKPKSGLISSGIHLLAIIFIPTGSIAIGAYTLREFSLGTAIIAITLLAINVTMFYLYDVLGRFYETRRNQERLEQQNKAYLNQLNVESELQRQLRYFRHDIENHFIKMNELLENLDYSGLTAYLKSCSEYTAPLHIYSNTGYKEVDAVLNYKLQRLGGKSINLKVRVSLPAEMLVDVFDLNIILGNLIDNAVEELLSLDEGRLAVEVKCECDVLLIKVENTYQSELTSESESIRTSKPDSELHGLGLQSVRHTLDKYNGDMSIKTEGGVFTVKVLVYNTLPG